MDILPKLKEKTEDKTFIIISKDYSGLGWAKMCVEAGYKTILATAMEEDDEKAEEFELAGNGIVDKMTLEEIIRNKKDYKDTYFIWDTNHNWEIADKLRVEGFKVFGGQEIADKCEHDRHFGTSLVKRAGLDTPPTFEFSDVESGLEFLDKNKDKAYVFKPDNGSEGCFTTYVPDSVKKEAANRELYAYLNSQEGDTGTYILQERIDGVEANFELWLYKGKPIFAHCNFESKRKLNHDEGELVGCSQDIEFKIPFDCKAIKLTIEKLLPYFRTYTGFLDMNVIVNDNIYFLEFCARYGYNSHPNLFLNLAKKSFPEIMADFMDGNIADFQDNFRDGFGASITLYIDHPKTGYPLYISEQATASDVLDKFYHFDTMKEDNDEENEYSLAGYSNEVGIVCAHAYTIKDAAKQCLKNTDKITYPMHACRTDLDLEDYESSPNKRFEALNAMKFFDKNI